MDAAFLKNRICIDQCKTSIDLSIRYLSHGHTENDTFFFERGYCSIFYSLIKCVYTVFTCDGYAQATLQSGHPLFDLLRYFLLHSVTDKKHLFSEQRLAPLY